MQRALVIMVSLAVINSPKLPRNLISIEEFQITFYHLGFLYRTMTVLWPGVLGGLCVIYTFFENKRRRIEHSLKCTSNKIRNTDIVEVDPFYVSASLFRSKIIRTIANLFALFPTGAIATHVLMLFMWIVTLDARSLYTLKRYFGEGFVGVLTGAVFLLSSVLFSVLGFFGTLSFWKTIREKIDIFRSNKDKHDREEEIAIIKK